MYISASLASLPGMVQHLYFFLLFFRIFFNLGSVAEGEGAARAV